MKSTSHEHPHVEHYSKHKMGYEPRHIVEEYSYHIATAMVYLLRSPYKMEDPCIDIRKAIDHLHFELERLEND